MPSPRPSTAAPVASNTQELDVVETCRSESSTSAYDSAIENEDAASEGERAEAEIEPEEGGKESASLKEKATTTEKERETETAELTEDKPAAATTQDEPELETPSDDSWKEEQKQPAARPATARSAESSSVSRRPFLPLAPKGWRARAMQSNTQITRLMKAALLQTLLHAIRTGSVEGVKVAIERGVQVQYLDSRQRNLVMLASKCDTDSRLRIVIILLDAGCDKDHKDQLGWSCLHYAWYVRHTGSRCVLQLT
jgi:hypothetical protein